MPNVYQLSVPYLARVIHIESTRPVLSGGGAEVQERVQQAGIFEPPEARG